MPPSPGKGHTGPHRGQWRGNALHFTKRAVLPHGFSWSIGYWFAQFCVQAIDTWAPLVLCLALDDPVRQVLAFTQFPGQCVHFTAAIGAVQLHCCLEQAPDIIQGLEAAGVYRQVFFLHHMIHLFGLGCLGNCDFFLTDQVQPPLCVWYWKSPCRSNLCRQPFDMELHPQLFHRA